MKRTGLYQQQGQALALGILFLSVLVLMLLALFGLARLHDAKNRLINAADSAAYSGALVQARALNMQAHINLAQVAHQVAMAHLVTLGSWAEWAARESDRLSLGNPPSYLIGMMFGADHMAAYQAARGARHIYSAGRQHGDLAQQYSQHEEIVHAVLAQLSQVIQQQLPSMRDQAVQAILQSNYPELQTISRAQIAQLTLTSPAKQSSNLVFSKMTQLRNAESAQLQWQTQDLHAPFIHRVPWQGPYRTFLQTVVADYHFLDKRQQLARNLWAIDPKCPFKRHELRRNGSTFLDQDGLWQATDTQSYHALRSNRWIGCYFREYPMGWAWISSQSKHKPEGFEFIDDAPENFSAMDFWRWVQSATQWNLFSGSSNPLANSYAAASTQKWGTRGLPALIDTKPGSTPQRLLFKLQLQQTHFFGLSLHSRAHAETFFERYQARSDAQHEAPNLWHPYWQARLVSDPSSKEQP
ncbi:TadE/TadG family type IV pilus assembly protein [Brackiella oedipodis]|uniref:TadE/TadG family type IV pilus assembly protein n=1 Tax=Brackiella oedipodis TaxID=124225 RepID=UPI000570ECC1|nr:Tad domain-containing protein [Brackiella oedipodis]